MIEAIKAALGGLDERVLCGAARKDDDNTWDCLLVRKEGFERSGTSKSDLIKRVSVRIIREDEIPEGMEQQVIACMKKIGWKQSGAPASYEYAIDANEVVVEICRIEFLRTFKGCDAS